MTSALGSMVGRASSRYRHHRRRVSLQATCSRIRLLLTMIVFIFSMHDAAIAEEKDIGTQLTEKFEDRLKSLVEAGMGREDPNPESQIQVKQLVLEAVVDKMIKDPPKVDLPYYLKLPTGPSGKEQRYGYVARIPPAALDLAYETGVGTQVMISHTKKKVQKNILALRPQVNGGRCQVCNQKKQTNYSGRPFFISIRSKEGMPSGLIVDPTPAVLCDKLECQNEHERRSLLKLQSLKQGWHNEYLNLPKGAYIEFDNCAGEETCRAPSTPTRMARVGVV